MQTKRIIKHAIQERLSIVLLINKVDRLILELKLPPVDAYYKLRHVVDQVNEQLAVFSNSSPAYHVSPELGNVCFASVQTGWSFTLDSFAALYYGSRVGTREFARRLWGNVYFHPQTRTFKRQPPPEGGVRSFVQFILEPLYKLYSQILGEDAAVLKRTLDELGVSLRREQYKLDTIPLLKLVLSNFFGRASGLVDMLADKIPSPVQAARIKVSSRSHLDLSHLWRVLTTVPRLQTEHIYTGPLDGARGQAMLKCDPEGPLMIHISKLYARVYPHPLFISFVDVIINSLIPCVVDVVCSRTAASSMRSAAL